MIRIAYGESSFKKVIEGDFFYQDRTQYVQKLENLDSQYIFYLRPRRFGKSLFVSMLHYYYGLEHKSDFDTLFGHLAIGKKPTLLANKYMVLSLEFSRIPTNTEENTFNGFLKNVREGVTLFLDQYVDVFPKDVHASILDQKQPREVIQALFLYHKRMSIVKELPQIYVLIDEYDHFANELISFNFKYFETSVSQNGFVRKFYETMKTATRDNVVDRIFVTGVSPVSLDSMTSGFNIGSNKSLDLSLHSMMGFEENEVKGILKGIGIKSTNLTTILNDLRAWYDGYLFNADAKKHLYNPDMVLYFAALYKANKKYPDEMLDTNIASDYRKIRNIFKIQQREEGHFNTLKILSDKGEIAAELTAQFSLEKEFGQDDLVSLLFYIGFFTIQARELGGFIFTFPNYVIQKLYADYFITLIKQQAELPIDSSELNFALRELAKFGTPQYLYDRVLEIVNSLSTRDAQGFNEGSLIAIFVCLLFSQ